MTSKPDAELAKWCAALTAESVTDEVPEGWLTASALADKLGKPASTVGKLLFASVKAGRCERRNFRIKTGSLVRTVPHYRPK